MDDLINLKMDRLASLSETNNAEIIQADMLFSAGKMTIFDFRVTMDTILKYNQLMLIELIDLIRSTKGVTRKNLKKSLKDTNRLIKDLKELLLLIDNDKVFEKVGEND